MSLQGLLESFRKPIIALDAKCERSGKGDSAHSMTHEMRPISIPSFVVLHLKRFICQEKGFGVHKGYRYFPSDCKYEKDQSFVEFPSLISISDLVNEEDIDDSERSFQLTAVIVHLGSSYDSGHYVAYAYQQNSWFYISDSLVRASTWNEVENSEAYLLFYSEVPAVP